MNSETPKLAQQPAAGTSRGSGKAVKAAKAGKRGRGGRGRASRGGRGGSRGISSGFSKQAPKQVSGNSTRAAPQRGRAKNFADTRIQAAYDRQRDLNATFRVVANAIKPALEDLCQRTISAMNENASIHESYPDCIRIKAELRQRLDSTIVTAAKIQEMKLKLADDDLDASVKAVHQTTNVRVESLYDEYLDGVIERLRVLESLHAKRLPTDVRDDRFDYRVIEDENVDFNFGPYAEYVNGNYVPYPHRVEGTRMWHLHQAKDAEILAEEAAFRAKPATRSRVQPKRKAQGQPEGQPNLKRPTRTSARLLSAAELSTPVPAKGLLAAVQEAATAGTETNTSLTDEASIQASPEVSIQASPEVSSPRNDDVLTREQMSPRPSRAASAPDEHGVRSYTCRFNDRITHSRFIIARPYEYEPHEIGFRDSTNAPFKYESGIPEARRIEKPVHKYTGKPNSSFLHLDHKVFNIDYTELGADDFDRDLVKKHNLIPGYGFFTSNSRNEQEAADSYVMPGKPIVFIANSSGRHHHASRSFQATATCRSVEEAPFRSQMSASLRRLCKRAAIAPEEIAATEYVATDEEFRARSLGTAVKELEAGPLKSRISATGVQERESGCEQEHIEETDKDQGEETEAADHRQPAQSDRNIPAMSVLAYATALEMAKDATRIAPPQASQTSRYDAIRDVFTSPQPDPIPDVHDHRLSLSVLAQICDVEPPMAKSGISTKDAAPVAVPARNSDTKRAGHRQEAPAPVPHAPVKRISNQQPATSYMRGRLRDSASMQLSSVVHASGREYPVQKDPVILPHVHGRSTELAHPPHLAPQPPQPPSASYPSAGRHMQDPNVYYSASRYLPSDPRETHLAPAQPVDPSYNPRAIATYSSEVPHPPPQNYGNHLYWHQQQQPQPCPNPVVPGAVPLPHQYAPLPPPPPPPAAAVANHSRNPFSQNASAEPLPPLRPPRSRHQTSVHEDPLHDARARHSLPNGMNSYFPFGPLRSFSRGYADPHPGSQPPLGPERALPNLHHHQQACMGSSPPPPYPSQPSSTLSPTFSNPPTMGGHGHMMQQSPPGTPQASASTHHYRHPPSMDAANGKYRKLQPAPVPAHRAWASKPELKTIFYDHKETTGSSAALPNSGPTQIRGWNVNQTRKRSRQDRADGINEREDSR